MHVRRVSWPRLQPGSTTEGCCLLLLLLFSSLCPSFTLPLKISGQTEAHPIHTLASKLKRLPHFSRPGYTSQVTALLSVSATAFSTSITCMTTTLSATFTHFEALTHFYSFHAFSSSDCQHSAITRIFFTKCNFSVYSVLIYIFMELTSLLNHSSTAF